MFTFLLYSHLLRSAGLSRRRRQRMGSRGWAGSLSLALLLVLWYASSAACTSCSKRLLATLEPRRCALELTCAQFGVAAVAAATPSALRCSPPTLPRAVWVYLVCISLSYTAGFTFLNLSLLYIPASFAETLRGLEPLYSAFIACATGVRGGALNRWSFLALVILVAGGFMSCWSQPAASRNVHFYLGIASALGANLAFALRSVFTTAAQDVVAQQWGEKLDADSIFFYQHACGFMVMLALVIVLGSSRVLVEVEKQVPSSLWLIVGSTGAFFLYNRLSLSVLLRLDAVSHSVCNALRRAATVAVTAVVFATPVSALSFSSIVLVICGSGG